MTIGTQNRSLKAPPQWATPSAREPGDFFSLFENSQGDQWAFLQRGREIVLAGSGVGWRTKKDDVEVLGNLTHGAAIDLTASVGERFGLELGLPERMWLAACILEVSARRETKRVAAAIDRA